MTRTTSAPCFSRSFLAAILITPAVLPFRSHSTEVRGGSTVARENISSGIRARRNVSFQGTISRGPFLSKEVEEEEVNHTR